MIDHDTIQSLDRRISLFTQARAQKNLAIRLKDQEDQLRVAIEQLNEASALLDGSHLGQLPNNFRKRRTDIAKTIRAEVATTDNLESIADSGVVAGAATRLKSLTDDVRILAERLWQEYLDSNPPPRIRDRVGLRVLPESKQVKVERSETTIDIHRQSRGLPSLKRFLEYQEAVEFLTSVQQQVDAEVVPPKVRVFLEMTESRDGAPLSKFTKEVFDWLTKNKLMEKFVIKRP